jgi:hypothetical protein
MRVVLAALFATASALAGGSSELSPCEARAHALFGDRAVLVRQGSSVASLPAVSKRVAVDLPDRWPAECRGSVVVHDLLIAPDGQVREAFTRRAPCRELERTARRSLLRWVFEPARRGSEPVAACLTMTTRFERR